MGELRIPLDWKLSTRNDFDGVFDYVTLSSVSIKRIIKALIVQSNNKKLGEVLLVFAIETRRGFKEWAEVELKRTKKKIRYASKELGFLNEPSLLLESSSSSQACACGLERVSSLTMQDSSRDTLKD